MTDHDERPIRVTDKRTLVDDDRPGANGAEDVSVDPDVEATEPEVEQAEPDLNAQLEAARAEAASHLDDLLRMKAEFENFRKRMVREQTAMIERASQAVIERMLPILDNFELALLAADRTKDYEAMVRGVELVYSELLDVLHKEGLERIDALGKPFDPEMHEAVMRAEGDDASMVVDEMRPGYTIAGRVVRPSMVKVGPAPGGAEGE